MRGSFVYILFVYILKHHVVYVHVWGFEALWQTCLMNDKYFDIQNFLKGCP